jgi:hypothetical protein
MRALLSVSALVALVGCTTPDEGKTDNTGNGQIEDTGEAIPERPDLPMGFDDAFSQAACGLIGEEGEDIIAASSMGEAGQVIFLPSDAGEALYIQMPESGPGFVTVEIPDWMTTVRFFGDDLAEYTIHGDQAEDLTGLRANGACPDERITDNRWAFHEWGSYVIEFTEDSPSEIWFVALKEEG